MFVRIKWDPVFDFLLKNYRVVTLDLRKRLLNHVVALERVKICLCEDVFRSLLFSYFSISFEYPNIRFVPSRRLWIHKLFQITLRNYMLVLWIRHSFLSILWIT